jgi:glycosyltransferase involved in cell wall biosynthesis
MVRVLIQGWRCLPHSYALVNTFQCLELLRRPELALLHEDRPFYDPLWRTTRGLLEPQQEQLIRSIPAPDPAQPADVTYRIDYPYNFGRSTTPRTIVFGTAECRTIWPDMMLGRVEPKRAFAESGAQIVTPSNWSRQGFIDSGADPDRITVIPHGFDPAIFHPATAEKRAELRRQFNSADSFVFLHLGAMTGNKNVPLLLRAFAVVAERYPHAKLVLKGLNSLYPSQKMVTAALASLPQELRTTIENRVAFVGAAVSMSAVAGLYQMADAYVSPYAAEAFNMPVLEAAACGLPVICTAGGPTDEFTSPQFALPVAAQLIPVQDRPLGVLLSADLGSLVTQMCRVIEDSSFAAGARSIAPAYVAERFTWKHVVDQLMKLLV